MAEARTLRIRALRKPPAFCATSCCSDFVNCSRLQSSRKSSTYYQCFMAIDPRFTGIVQGCAIVAAVIGLLLGWLPGTDIVGLLVLWFIGFVLILDAAGVQDIFEHWFKLVLTIVGAGFIFAAGVEIARDLTLPVFYVVNPILDYIATYRVLRAAAKLYAKSDPEETLSQVLSSVWSLIKIILGIDDD
jgi:hypothetical protein